MEVIQACHVKKIEKIALVSEGLIALLEMETNAFLSFNIKNIKNEIRLVIQKPVTNSNIKQYCFFWRWPQFWRGSLSYAAVPLYRIYWQVSTHKWKPLYLFTFPFRHIH